MTKESFIKTATTIALVFAVAGSATAKTSTSPAATVGATVVANCLISTSASDIAFGDYDPTSSTDLAAQGSTQIRCTRGATYWTYITGTRSFTIGGDTLNFQLYTDAGHTIVYPAVKTGGGSVSPSNAAKLIEYFGLVAAGQNVGVGSGTANLVFTVEF